MSVPRDYEELSIWDLFRIEVEGKTVALTDGLLLLDRGDRSASVLEDLMRAAHSLKGAAQMVEARPAVRVAHIMEDWFVAMQQGSLQPDAARMDVLLEGVDLIRRIAAGNADDTAADEATDAFIAKMEAVREDAGGDVASETTTDAPATADESSATSARDDESVRVTAERMNRLLSLASESLIAARWLDEFIAESARAQQHHRTVSDLLERLRESLAGDAYNSSLLDRVADVQRHFGELRRSRTAEIASLSEIQQRTSGVSTRLYREVVDLRMRPFGEGVAHLGRLIRSLSRQLGKKVQLEIRGSATPVDREILERLDASIVNLIRNAIDHGIESPEERRRLGKPETGTIVLDAVHRAGMLFITAEDDGRGVDMDALRRIVASRKHTTEDVAAQLTDAEILDFLFLPGFSMRDTVSEVSGRGVGLDIVQTAARAAGGKVTLHARPGNGLQFVFQLPLTLSVIRALLFEVGGEPYAVPIARVGRVLKMPKDQIESVEGRQHIEVEGDRIGLVGAHQILDIAGGTVQDNVSILVLGHGATRYGITVDRLIGERELVVRSVEPLLGKIQDIGSAALLPDGTPVLIIDVEDVLRSIEILITGGRVQPASQAEARAEGARRKRILVVDDSFTVRELERKLLTGRGYDVDVAVDGVDGWNAVRTGNYDLVVSDVDMPRMDGIELVTRIRQDPRLHLLPIIIVSYKEREEDKLRGMEAGADRYLAKGSYHDESLLNAIIEQIGTPEDA